ncbi:hypothetical protein MAP00_004166 [Monascus purpureus]|nr:hypothetical protein MAP00_004166 [Monascus purpureus]
MRYTEGRWLAGWVELRVEKAFLGLQPRSDPSRFPLPVCFISVSRIHSAPDKQDMDPNHSKIILVTGANQGLGLAVIEVAGIRYPSNTYILGARDIQKGKGAIAELRDRGVSAPIDVVELDATNDAHIAAAVRHVETQYGRLDGKARAPHSS